MYTPQMISASWRPVSTPSCMFSSLGLVSLLLMLRAERSKMARDQPSSPRRWCGPRGAPAKSGSHRLWKNTRPRLLTSESASTMAESPMLTVPLLQLSIPQCPSPRVPMPAAYDAVLIARHLVTTPRPATDVRKSTMLGRSIKHVQRHSKLCTLIPIYLSQCPGAFLYPFSHISLRLTRSRL